MVRSYIQAPHIITFTLAVVTNVLYLMGYTTATNLSTVMATTARIEPNTPICSANKAPRQRYVTDGLMSAIPTGGLMSAIPTGGLMSAIPTGGLMSAIPTGYVVTSILGRDSCIFLTFPLNVRNVVVA